MTATEALHTLAAFARTSGEPLGPKVRDAIALAESIAKLEMQPSSPCAHMNIVPSSHSPPWRCMACGAMFGSPPGT